MLQCNREDLPITNFTTPASPTWISIRGYMDLLLITLELKKVQENND